MIGVARHKPDDDGDWRKQKQPRARLDPAQMSRCAAAAIGRMVRVSVVPHWTQPWVTSSSSVSGPFWPSTSIAYMAGLTPVTAMRCPQNGQGSRKVGSRDGATDGCRMTHTPKAYVISRLKLE